MTDAFSSNRPVGPAPKPDDVSFDLDLVLSSVVSVRAHIPEDAMTASMLGTERAGHGVVIRDDGLVLTIGYLISEADAVWLVDHKGRATSAHVVGYDQETGFGLVQALEGLDLPAIELGNSSDLHEGDAVIVAGQGGRDNDLKHQLGAYGLLRDLARDGMSVIAVTHDLNLAAHYADRVIVISEGRIAVDGQPEDVLTASMLAEVFEVDAEVGEGPTGKPWVFYDSTAPARDPAADGGAASRGEFS